MSAVFVTYNGLLDPLGASQVLPYVERLSRGRTMSIVSFERAERLADAAALQTMTDRLRTSTIDWVQLRYTKGGLLAKLHDLRSGVAAVRTLAKRHEVRLVHARGYVPAEIALRARVRAPILFDIRGLQAEEYVDAGIWKQGDLRWRLTKRTERRLFRDAAGFVVLTRAIEPWVRERIGGARPLEVIPCCVDLLRFRRDGDASAALRADEGVPADAVVFLYSGSLGTWYPAEEMAAVVAAYRRRTQRQVRLWWLVNNDPEIAVAASRSAGLDESEFRVRSVRTNEIPAWLGAADVGLALVRPSFSKRASSPTKYAEFLACEVPLLVAEGVGDSEELVADGVAAAVSLPITSAGLEAAVSAIDRLRSVPRERLRSVAVSRFDVDAVAHARYERLYRALGA